MRMANLDQLMQQLRSARGQLDVVLRRLSDYSNQLRTTFSRFMSCSQDELRRLLTPSLNDRRDMEQNVPGAPLRKYAMEGGRSVPGTIWFQESVQQSV